MIPDVAPPQRRPGQNAGITPVVLPINAGSARVRNVRMPLGALLKRSVFENLVNKKKSSPFASHLSLTLKKKSSPPVLSVCVKIIMETHTQKKQCAQCQQNKSYDQFSNREWGKRETGARCCKACKIDPRGPSCCICNQSWSEYLSRGMVVKNTQGNVICINCIPPDELKSLVEAKCLKYIGKKNPSQQEMLTGKIPDFKTMGEFTMAIASHQVQFQMHDCLRQHLPRLVR